MKSEVDGQTAKKLLDPYRVVLINYIVTEAEYDYEDFRDPELASMLDNVINQLKSHEESNLKISEEHDQHNVLDLGVFEPLLTTGIPYKCKQGNNDFIYLGSLIYKEIASSQGFTDGNKRTAYLSLVLFLANYQSYVLEIDSPVVPVLDDEFLEFTEDISEGKLGVEDVVDFLSETRKDIENKIIDKESE